MTHAKLFMSSMILAACATTLAEDTDPAAPPDVPALEPGEAWVYVATASDGSTIRATCDEESVVVDYYMECPHWRTYGLQCASVEGVPGGADASFFWMVESYPDWNGRVSWGGRFEPAQELWPPEAIIDSTFEVTQSGGMLRGAATMSSADGSYQAMRFEVPAPGAPTVECDGD